MARLSGLLPVAQGVAAYTALGRDADALIAAGDGRTRGQLMADLMVERLTGQSEAAAVPVEIGLIMTDRTLLHGDAEPAVLAGYGPIPAPTARELAARRGGEGRRDEVGVWLRQLYTHPHTGELVAMSSKRRFFPAALRRFITNRDRYCRTPYCGAPIRHIDHIRPKSRGGATDVANGQGQCVACNLAKEAPGWSSRPEIRRGRHTVRITTPTGHSYRSRAPDLPGRTNGSSALEDQFRRLLGAA
jgi:hypothetical protein